MLLKIIVAICSCSCFNTKLMIVCLIFKEGGFRLGGVSPLYPHSYETLPQLWSRSPLNLLPNTSAPVSLLICEQINYCPICVFRHYCLFLTFSKISAKLKSPKTHLLLVHFHHHDYLKPRGVLLNIDLGHAICNRTMKVCLFFVLKSPTN